VGAIACQPDGSRCELFLHWQEETLKGPGIISVLDKLHRQVAGPIVLLWDGLPAHKSRVVGEHIKKQEDWLRLEWLPAYAPEINPPEYLWSSLKGKEMANVCPDTLGELSGILAKAGKRIGREQSLLQDFLKASSLFDG
jgi:transposase